MARAPTGHDKLRRMARAEPNICNCAYLLLDKLRFGARVKLSLRCFCKQIRSNINFVIHAENARREHLSGCDGSQKREHCVCFFLRPRGAGHAKIARDHTGQGCELARTRADAGRHRCRIGNVPWWLSKGAVVCPKRRSICRPVAPRRVSLAARNESKDSSCRRRPAFFTASPE